MNRNELRALFKTSGPAILPVIHALDFAQVLRNTQIAIRTGAHGVFLINHDFEYQKLLPIVQQLRSTYPWLWIGLNFLAVTGKDAFPVLGTLEKSGTRIDAYWADDARIDERVTTQSEADDIAQVRQSSSWNGLYFGGTAFKKQREVKPELYYNSAEIATGYLDVVTTSGVATGEAADLTKIQTFRHACGEHALAVASGVTPENVADYTPLLDAILIATGINHPGDFYNINAEKLQAVLNNARHASI